MDIGGYQIIDFKGIHFIGTEPDPNTGVMQFTYEDTKRNKEAIKKRMRDAFRSPKAIYFRNLWLDIPEWKTGIGDAVPAQHIRKDWLFGYQSEDPKADNGICYYAILHIGVIVAYILDDELVLNVKSRLYEDDSLTPAQGDKRYVNVTGDSMTGNLSMTLHRVTDLADPIRGGDAVNLNFHEEDIEHTIADCHNYTDQQIALNKYVLKQATELELGGVRAPVKTETQTQPVGIDPETGKLFVEAGSGQVPEYTLPVATSTILGGVRAPAKTTEQTEPVGIATDGKLYVKPAPTPKDIPVASQNVIGGIKAPAKTGKDTTPVAVDSEGNAYVEPTDLTEVNSKLDANSKSITEINKLITGIEGGGTDLPYVKRAGDTMTGDLNMGSHNVKGLPNTPTADNDATSKKYVDSQITEKTEAVKYILPVASANALGGVKASPKTSKQTEAVGVDESGNLYYEKSAGGGGVNIWYETIDVKNKISSTNDFLDTTKPITLTLKHIGNYIYINSLKGYTSKGAVSGSVGVKLDGIVNVLRRHDTGCVVYCQVVIGGRNHYTSFAGSAHTEPISQYVSYPTLQFTGTFGLDGSKPSYTKSALFRADFIDLYAENI